MHSAHAAALTWDANGATAGQTDGAGGWLAANQWWTGSANTTWASGSDAVFGNGGTGDAVILASPTTVNSLTFNSFSGTYTLGTVGQAITLNTGITMNSTAGAVTISSPITLGGSQIWTNGTAFGTLTVADITGGGNSITLKGGSSFAQTGAFSGSGSSLVLDATYTGTATLNQANTYTGATTVNGGALAVVGSGSLGNTAIAVANPGSTFSVISSVDLGFTATASAGATLNLGSGTVFSMVDGFIGTASLNQGSSFSSTALTLNSATLKFDLSSAGADQLAITGAATTASVTGTNTISITPVGTSLTPGTYSLITTANMAGGLSTGGIFRFANGVRTKTAWAGSNLYTLTLANSANAERVTVASLPAAMSLTASDGATNDAFGFSVSQSGTIGLVGAYNKNSSRGAAYVFRNLDIAAGTVNQNVKLTASDSATADLFGTSVSQSGTIGLVGAYGKNSSQGAAYVFRDLDTATGTVTQNVKLTASDGAAGDFFGSSVSQSGTIGLVGAESKNTGRGAAYVFRNLDTAAGTVTQNVKLTASDGAANDHFGSSVSLSGDRFTIGAYGKNSSTGAAYSGTISSLTTLDDGSASRTIDRLSFISQDDWIIGQSTSANQVTLNPGNAGDVTASGKAVYLGKNAGSNNNTLIIAGDLIATQITVGAPGNTGNILQLGAGGVTGTLSPGSVITNRGTVVFNRSDIITQGAEFGSAAIAGTGGVRNAGIGTTILTAANTFSGKTEIAAGTLALSGSGSVANSPEIAIASGATLDVSAVTGGANYDGTRFALANGQTLHGTGTVLGDMDVNAGATIAPGNSVGTLAISGLSLTSATSHVALEIDLSPTPAADLLNVTGGISLNNSTLDLSLSNLTPTGLPKTFLFATNDLSDPVTGIFGSITGVPNGYNATLNYAYTGTDALGRIGDGNDLAVTFTTVPEPAPIAWMLLSGALALGRRWRALNSSGGRKYRIETGVSRGAGV